MLGSAVLTSTSAAISIARKYTERQKKYFDAREFATVQDSLTAVPSYADTTSATARSQAFYERIGR